MTKIFHILFLYCEILLKMSDLDGVFIIFLTAYLGLFYFDHVSFNHGISFLPQKHVLGVNTALASALPSLTTGQQVQILTCC